MSFAYENKSINQGTKVRATCVSRGGNPLPEIEWSLVDKTKLAGLKTESTMYAESIYEFVIEREHHNQILECKAVNKVKTLSKSIKLTVSCKFWIKICLSFDGQMKMYFNIVDLPKDVDMSIVQPAIGQSIRQLMIQLSQWRYMNFLI